MTSSIFHLRVMGMIASRMASSGAFRLMAKRGRTGSWAKRRMPGTMPEVETVILDSASDASFTSRRTAAMKLVVVQEGLAHAHEDQVDPVPSHLDCLALQHGDHLASDFARGKISLQSQFCGEAELAVHGAAHLAGDADGGSQIAGFPGVPLLGSVTPWHPNGLYCLPVLTGDQVALGTVDGAESLDNPGPFDAPARLCQLPAQAAREGLDLVEPADPVLKHGLEELASPVGGLPQVQPSVL